MLNHHCLCLIQHTGSLESVPGSTRKVSSQPVLPTLYIPSRNAIKRQQQETIIRKTHLYGKWRWEKVVLYWLSEAELSMPGGWKDDYHIAEDEVWRMLGATGNFITSSGWRSTNNVQVFTSSVLLSMWAGRQSSWAACRHFSCFLRVYYFVWVKEKPVCF